MTNTISDPIIFKRNHIGYSTNKPGDRSGLYVDLSVAMELLKACLWAKGILNKLGKQGKYPEFLLQENGGNGLTSLTSIIDKHLPLHRAELEMNTLKLINYISNKSDSIKNILFFNNDIPTPEISTLMDMIKYLSNQSSSDEWLITEFNYSSLLISKKI